MRADHSGGVTERLKRSSGPCQEDRWRKPRLLDFRSATALVIASTIGARVFTTSGFALAELGDPSLVMLAWLVGGLYALTGVIIYSDLACKYPVNNAKYLEFEPRVHAPWIGYACD